MKSATTHFICRLCQSRTGKSGFTKRWPGKSRARFDGHYSDHSLRHSCTSATRLYGGGFPEQLSQETTGHRSSDAVRAYKCTSSTLKRKASQILQGSLSKKALIDAEKTDENGDEKNYTTQEDKLLN